MDFQPLKTGGGLKSIPALHLWRGGGGGLKAPAPLVPTLLLFSSTINQSYINTNI